MRRALTHFDAVAASQLPLDRRAAARDLWPGGTLRMWEGEASVEPDRVLWPEDDAEVFAVLERAALEGVPVVTYGAGSGVCGGAAGRAGAWVLDTKRFDQIGQVDPVTRVVEVDAGVNGQHLEDALERQGYTLGHSPSSIGCSTVGGWAAARSAGQFSSRYGVFEDMVLGLDAVAPGVGPFTVGLPGARSSTQVLPEDSLDLLLGSEGTLAVITRVRVRVRPIPSTRWLRGYRFPTVEAALSAMRRLMQAELWPAVLRLYDPVDTLIGGKTKPKAHSSERAWWRSWLEAVDRIDPIRRRALVLPLSMPGLLQSIVEHFAQGVLLIVGWEGEPAVVDAAVQAGGAILGETGEDLGEGPGERWYASRHSVSYKLMPVFEHGGFADTMEIAGRWSVLPRAYAAVREAVGSTVLVMAHMSHAYPEGGCIYFSFAGRGDGAVYRQLWERALKAVLASGATVTHHHGVGALKADAATREVGPAVAGWVERKALLDPSSILNPGRVFLVGPGAPPASTPATAPVLDADGLAPWGALPEQGEPRWAWESAGGPPRAAREPWQSAWHEVHGTVNGTAVSLGRGPRSAAGPDLRRWLVAQDSQATVQISWAHAGPRWMGEAVVDRPWAVARALLRADLRPAVLTVVEGRLRVGFRGPAASAFGAIASRAVPGGLAPVAWCWAPSVPAALEICAEDDPAVVHVTTEFAWRKVSGLVDGEPGLATSGGDVPPPKRVRSPRKAKEVAGE